MIENGVDASRTGAARSGGLFIRHKLPFGLSWLYCPRGPLCDYSKPTQLNALMKKLAPIAQQERAVFLRIDPPLEINEINSAQKLPAQNFPAGFRTAYAQYQPEHTLIIDLSLPEEQILNQMKPKGRYNIRVSQKHGIKIRAASPSDKNFKKDLDAFYEILTVTADRDKFSVHPKFYYENMLKILGPQNLAQLFLAEYTATESAPSSSPPHQSAKIIAGIIVTFFNQTATYYFGASDYEHRNLMAPYLLQWEAIREARQRGCKFYDFLGIAPLDKFGAPIKGHKYSKITDFKLKFGGRIVSYTPAKEFIFKPVWYQIIKLAKKFLQR